ncbi:unnamed protein product [Rotaria sp. Silwood1]|nr:unnamed protein product [Rotaria sp. Silwood1]
MIERSREKRVRQKFNSDIELQAYEKRLKDIEKKIRQLVKRAFEIFDEKRSISSPPTVTRTTKTDLLLHNRSKSTNYFQDESSISDETSIHRKDTELTKKDTNTSSNSTQQRQSDVVTSDASDLERRVRAYREQLKAKKFELEKLKQRKNKEILRRQEDELKKQIESCDYEIQTLRLQPIQQEQTVPIPSPYIHSNTSSPSTERKKSNLSKSDKQILSPKQNIFEERPLETPRDERDTQDDALSISVTTDLPNEFEIDHDSQHININNDKQITDVNIYSSILSKEKEDSISSSSITSEKHTISLSPRISRSPSPPPPPPLAQEPIKSPLPSVHEYIKSSSSLVEERLKTLSQEQIFVPINELKQSEHSSINSEYGEDFSEVSHSPIHTSVKIQTNDIESIEDDIHNKSLKHDSNKSSSSKTSDDEQSEILVLNIKSTNNILEQQDNKDKLSTLPSQTLLISKKIESDNTTHDINENDQGNKHLEQDNKIDKLTEILVRTFIDEAIEHGKQIQNSLTKEASEWIPAEDVISEENNKQILTNHEEEIDNEIPTFSKEPDGLDQSDTTTNETNDDEELMLDLARLVDDKLDETRDTSPRKSLDKESTIQVDDDRIKSIIEESTKTINEEPIKPVVSHTREQVIQLCHEALIILYNQNNDFSDRLTINRTIPDSYFNYEQQDSDNEDIQRSHHAYYRMIFDLCVELLCEMYSPNVRITKYPEWQKTKLIRKRFYRSHKPNNINEAEYFIQKKILEILNLIPNHITYPKWRISSIGRHSDTEQFENVLDEELRRTESQWIDYEDDCLRIKFDIAEYIFDRLLQETLTECFHIVNKRLVFEQTKHITDSFPISKSNFGERNIRPRKRLLNDDYLYCDNCQKYSHGLCPQGCQTYESNHQADHAKNTVPVGIKISTSNIPTAGLGVFAIKEFPKNTFFGPYTGERHRSTERANKSGYAWTIEDAEGNVYNYIDASNPSHSNWLRYVNCPTRQVDENLIPVQFNGELYYQTSRDIKAGEELFVYYGEEALGINSFEHSSIEENQMIVSPSPKSTLLSSSIAPLKKEQQQQQINSSKKRKGSKETLLNNKTRYLCHVTK